MTSQLSSSPSPGAAGPLDWLRLETALGRDPNGRRLVGCQPPHQPLAAGHLADAAGRLAGASGSVAIVTGFCAPSGETIAAETDGPPGALYLARALRALDIEVVLLTDCYGMPLLRAGCDLWGLESLMLVEIPFEDADADHASRRSNEPQHNTRTQQWIDDFLRTGPGSRLSHVISVERPGPAHTPDSLAVQTRSGAAPVDAFRASVAAPHWDVCHNVRGELINSHTAKSHLLFDRIAQQELPITTIGIGDGGNEIGLGSIPWERLCHALDAPHLAHIVCRVPTDYVLLAGVSDWAAYALALGVCCLRGKPHIAAPWDAAGQCALVECLVREGGAVDGITLRREATVDGLPMAQYSGVLNELRAACGLSN